jgi:hypothetical protein
MTPAEKLDRSRLAIIGYLERREHRGEPRANDDAPDGDDGGHEGGHLFSSDGWLGGVASAARVWWRHHPAQLAVEMATPALRSYMRKRPFQVLALSAGVGALLVVTRPWRLVSLTTLVVAIVKSSQLSGVVMSVLSDTQGWQSQQQGSKPPL